MVIKPLQDRILIRPDTQVEEKVGSIFVPANAQEKPQEGTVEVVGPGRMEDGKVITPEVKIGDRVLYGKYSGIEIKREGVDFLIVREADILAVVD